MQRTTVTLEQFSKMVRMRFVPLVEKDRLAQEYLDLRQTIVKVMEITKMFTERGQFCPEFVASDKAQMTGYMSMLKRDI